MNQNHTCLKIVLRPTDYRLGDGRLKGVTTRVASGNWFSYYDFFERQLLNTGDTNGCVLFSTQETFDAQMEWQIQNGLVPQSVLAQFTALGYMDTATDGTTHFHTSPRWLQILTGNGLNGNSVQDGCDALRSYGPLPYTDLPVDPTLTPEQYVDASAITPAMKAKAAQFLALIGGKQAIQYQWITDGGTDVQATQELLVQAPALLGVNVGTDWNVTQPPPPPASAGGQPGHCVSNYWIDSSLGSWIYDHYTPNPKDLVSGYPIWYSLQMVVSPVFAPPTPPATPITTNTPASNSAWSNWLSAVSAWLRNLFESSTLSGRQKLGGARRSNEWPALRKKFLQGKVCGICGGTNKLEAHHVIPFSVDSSKELDENNLYPLCEGKKSVNCHLIYGHYGNFATKYNKDIRTEAPLWKKKITAKVETDL